MTPFEMVRALTEIKGRVKTAYQIAEQDSGLEIMLDSLEDDIDSLIEGYLNSHCCSVHFIRGGMCKPEDHMAFKRPSGCCEHE